MDLPSIVLLVLLGFVLGYVVRSGLRLVMKVAIAVLALAVVHMASPDGFPRMITDGLEWIWSRGQDLLAR